MVLARYPPSINVTFPDRVETLRGGLQHTMLPVVGHLMHCITCIPISGTASDVVGIFSATRLRNTVNERRMVTPEIRFSILNNATCFSLSSLKIVPLMLKDVSSHTSMLPVRDCKFCLFCILAPCCYK